MPTTTHPLTAERTLRADDRTLQAVGAASNAASLPATTRRAAEDAGLAREDGSLTDLGWLLGRTVAAPALTATVRKLHGGRAARLVVRASPASVVIAAPTDHPTEVTDIRVGPPDGLVRMLLDLLDLDPRIPDARQPIDAADAEDPLAPFLTATPAGWTIRLGADTATLVRLELEVGTQRTAVVLADLGAAGVWRADADADAGTSWHPTSCEEVVGELARLQRPLGPAAGTCGGRLPQDRRTVDLPGLGVRVGVPPGWERVDSAPPMALVARSPLGHHRPASITVASDDPPESDDVVDLARSVADALPAGRLLAAVQHTPGDRYAAYLHAGRRGDLVTCQRQLDIGGRTVVTSVTADAATSDDWLDDAHVWLAAIERLDTPCAASIEEEPSTPDLLDLPRVDA